MMDIPIEAITVGDRRRPARDVTELVRSIEAIGLLQPIVIDTENRLLAGLHRLEAVKALGWARIPARVVDLGELEAELAEIDENLIRNELSYLERAEHLARRKEIYEARFPETKAGVAGGRARQGSASDMMSFADDTAAKVGVTPRSVQREVKIANSIPEPIRDAIRDTPLAESKTDLIALSRMAPDRQAEVVERVTAGGFKDVRQATQAMNREERFVSISSAGEVKELGRFPVIYADPPWRYDYAPVRSQEIENQYPTMDIDDIRAMDLDSISAGSAVLFLWATNPKLEEALSVVNAWGFSYRTAMVWVKSSGYGMGYWARQNHEQILIATRGDMPAPAPENRPASVVNAPKGLHSEKPDVFYEIIERMFPDLPRLELFARKARPGWARWGNQA